MSDLAAIVSWLTGLGLARYAAQFERHRIDLAQLAELTDADLREIGVAALGDRKRLLKAAAALREPPAAGGSVERRQLTVAFCDLVGSTGLAARLDPEDLRLVVRDYHDAVAAAVAPWGGHVAQLLGDGVLVYFGYPRAHEDDAVRAVRAALDAVRAVAQLSAPDGGALCARVGIATGKVVVGDAGASAAPAWHTASGETPNLSARLQEQAAPGEVVLSDDTRRLLGAAFEFESLGAIPMRGFGAPVTAWRVLRERRAASRFEVQRAASRTPFVGRDSELALLADRWSLARDGEGQMVLLVGEPGIGKSRTCVALAERIGGEPHRTMLLQCSPFHVSSALYPVAHALERIAEAGRETVPEKRAAALRRWVREVAPRLGAGRAARLLRLAGLQDATDPDDPGETAARRKAATLEALAELVLEAAARAPLLLVVEDAHWIDPTTEDFLADLRERTRAARLMLLVTSRPEYAPAWAQGGRLTQLTMGRLGHRHAAQLATAVAGAHVLSAEVLDEIVRRTDGIPLFVEEITRAVVESGEGPPAPGRSQAAGVAWTRAIPATLQDSLTARLDRFSPGKAFAQAGAAIGRSFSHALLSEVCGVSGVRLEHALGRLIDADLLFRRGVPPDAVYTFKHALVRDTAYQGIPRGQRAALHCRIAEAIGRVEPATAAMRPELLAHHYREGGELAAALAHWRRAAELAIARSAVREAAAHCRAALETIEAMPERHALAAAEFDLLLELGSVLTQVQGYGSAESLRASERARAIATATNDPERYVEACRSTASVLAASGRLREAMGLFAPMTDDDLQRLSPMGRASRAWMLGASLVMLGEQQAAAVHLSAAVREIERVEAAQERFLAGVEPRAAILAWVRANRWYLGQPEQARALADETAALAQRSGHAPAIALALQVRGMALLCAGDAPAALAASRQLREVSERFEIPHRLASALIIQGQAEIAAGDVDAGERSLREGFERWCETGAVLLATDYACGAADSLLRAGRVEAARHFVAECERLVDSSGERVALAELERLRGRLGEREGDDSAALQRYRTALQVARRQGAAIFALRAATDLATLLDRQGRGAEGAAELRAVYGGFTEGFGYPDLRRAARVLAAIAA